MLKHSDYTFTYHWKHIPTGKKGVVTKTFISYEDFIDSINKWNIIGDGTWIYWR